MKYSIAVFLGLILLVGGVPAFVSAQSTGTTTLSALQTQIASLLAHIKTLQDELARVRGQEHEIRTDLHELRKEFKTTLREGMSGDEVRELQEFLASDPELYPEGIISGHFGALTAKAVKRFQKKHNLEQVGEVGPLTRARLNALLEEFPNLPPEFVKKLEMHVATSSNPKRNNQVFLGKGIEKIAVCHKGKTIHFGAPGARAHLAHGDSAGTCGGNPGNNGNSTDTVAPVITGLLATSTGATTAIIKWSTNENASSKVFYDTTAGFSIGTATLSAMVADLVTSHSVPLYGLTASTTYYYRTVSTDISNNTATSSEQSFTTTP